MVHNLPENESSSVAETSKRDQDLLKDIIKKGLHLSVQTARSFRVGRKMEGKERLLIVTLEDAGTKAELLKLAPQLRHLETPKRIYITPDQTKKEREEGRKLREELAARRQAGESNITIRRGKIVKLNTEAQAAETRPKTAAVSGVERTVEAETRPKTAAVSGVERTDESAPRPSPVAASVPGFSAAHNTRVGAPSVQTSNGETPLPAQAAPVRSSVDDSAPSDHDQRPQPGTY